MWDLCKMLNIWHISHTKYHLTPFIRCSKCHIFCNMLQYRCKFATVRNQNGIIFNHFLFSFLSLLLSSLYSFLFSLTPILSHRFPLFSATGSLCSQPPIPSILSFPFNLRSVWRWPLSPKVRVAWATRSPLTAHEPLPSLVSLPLTAHEPSSLPTSKTRRAIVIVIALWSRRSLPLSLSLLVVGCFDCCWLADFGWWW